MLHYNSRIWLNPEDISSTGSIVCYAGESPWKGIKYTRFVEVADCHGKVRLHQTDKETLPAYIKKLKTMHAALGDYIRELEKEDENDKN